MKKAREPSSREQKLKELITELHKFDCWIDFKKLKKIVSYGNALVPHLEKILCNVLGNRSKISLQNPPKDAEWFIVIHVLYLLAQLRSENSLDLILEFLSQKVEFLDYWLHDILCEDIWEVIYYLGQNQLNELEAFVLNQNVNVFSRLTVCTALIQMSARHKSKREEVARIFKRVFGLENEDPDFIGLLASELLDIKDESLHSGILNAIEQHNVWPGIISTQEVHLLYKNKKVRTLEVLDIFQRYKCFRQYGHFAQSRPLKPIKMKSSRKLKNQS